MKANGKSLMHDSLGVGTVPVSLAGILITIIITAVIFFSLTSTGQFAEITETNTVVVDADNSTVWTLSYPPSGTSEINLTIYNSTGGPDNVTGYGTASQFSLSGKVLTINTTTYNMTSLAIAYYTQTGVLTRNAVNPMATTVFGLWILVPLIVIGMLLIGIMVVRSGKDGEGGGL